MCFGPPMPKISRQYIEMDEAMRRDLKKALERRAAQISEQTKVEVKPQFASWLRDMAKQTIAAYR
jgi:hypothetical protein